MYIYIYIYICIDVYIYVYIFLPILCHNYSYHWYINWSLLNSQPFHFTSLPIEDRNLKKVNLNRMKSFWNPVWSLHRHKHTPLALISAVSQRLYAVGKKTYIELQINSKYFHGLVHGQDQCCHRGQDVAFSATNFRYLERLVPCLQAVTNSIQHKPSKLSLAYGLTVIANFVIFVSLVSFYYIYYVPWHFSSWLSWIRGVIALFRRDLCLHAVQKWNDIFNRPCYWCLLL